MITHTEKIKCPDCGTTQDATVEHTVPFHTYLHNCEKCNFTIMESDWEAVKATQQTAMMQLRDRLQARLAESPFRDERVAIHNTINLIDTELLEIEKQQRKEDILIGYNNAGELPIEEILNLHI